MKLLCFPEYLRNRPYVPVKTSCSQKEQLVITRVPFRHQWAVEYFTVVYTKKRAFGGCTQLDPRSLSVL